MSDLFKDHGSELSDDEDRRLWQRVRAIPGEAAGEAPGRAPWWRALWAMPAVRYGAPAFAVLLVAVVWVVERRPEPPTRALATRAVNQLDRKAEAPQSAAPENAPAPMAQAPPAVLESREKLAKKSHAAESSVQGQGQESKDETAGRADGGALPEREFALKAAPAPAPATAESKEAQKFAAAPTQPARAEVTTKSSAPAPPTAWRGACSRRPPNSRATRSWPRSPRSRRGGR